MGLSVLAISDNAETALRIAKTLACELDINSSPHLETRIKAPTKKVMAVVSPPLKIEELISTISSFKFEGELLIVSYFKGEDSYAILLTPKKIGVSIITPKQFWNVDWVRAIAQLKIRAESKT